jgi:hypothetical protein
MSDELTSMSPSRLRAIAQAMGLEPPARAPARALRRAIRDKRAAEAAIAALDDDTRCGALAYKGTGQGACDRPVDAHGQCDRPGAHVPR